MHNHSPILHFFKLKGQEKCKIENFTSYEGEGSVPVRMALKAKLRFLTCIFPMGTHEKFLSNPLFNNGAQNI